MAPRKPATDTADASTENGDQAVGQVDQSAASGVAQLQVAPPPAVADAPAAPPAQVAVQEAAEAPTPRFGGMNYVFDPSTGAHTPMTNEE